MRSMEWREMILFGGIVLSDWGCARESQDHARPNEGGHGHAGHSDQEPMEQPVRGSRGGRLFPLEHGQLELGIEEEDGPPIFVAWLHDGQDGLFSPTEATLAVTLRRLGDRVDHILFSPMGNHLRGDVVVHEPHSFEATIALDFDGKTYEFSFEQHEYRVELSREAVERAGLVTQPAGPGHIDVRVEAPGEVRLNGERMLTVRPRFAGVVTAMNKKLGDSVRAGELLTSVQSNNSLSEYEIVAPMAGSIVARSGMIGEAVDNESVLYTLADLSSVWVDFAIYPQHVGIIQRGQVVTVRAATQPDLVAEGRVSYVGPLLEEDTRVSHGRIVLPNSGGRWQPGLYVDVSAVVDHADVAVSVPDEAIIRSRFGASVFIADGTTFELQPVRTGRTDGSLTEIVEGLQEGLMIVVKNAYLLKAELGRDEATHDH